MTRYATITPSRGDRKELLNFCMGRLADMNELPNSPVRNYIMAGTPIDEKIDLVRRVRNAVEWAEADGIDFVFIIEDDDFYPMNYFSLFGDLDNVDFVGFSDTKYYNLKTRTYQRFDHPERSSLFTTGFRISALDIFNWPKDDYKWLDVALWDYANRAKKRIKLLKDNPCVGIKAHGMGLCAGKGHVIPLKNTDTDLSVLKGAMDKEAFEFYTGLMEKITA